MRMLTTRSALAVSLLVALGTVAAPPAGARPLYECGPERTYCPSTRDAAQPRAARGVDGGTGGERLADGSAPRTLWIGDSLSKRAAPAVAQQHPEFYIDYKGGRPVKAANQLIERFVTQVNPRPANLVFALGTNNSPGEWTKARLEAAIAKVPASTRVYLLAPVRPSNDERAKDANLRTYDRWNKELRDSRRNTYIVNWRQTVLDDPSLKPATGRSRLLEDGVHQTGSAFGARTPGPGIDTFVRLFLSKMRSTGGIS